jgi:hypothetical protein
MPWLPNSPLAIRGRCQRNCDPAILQGKIIVDQMVGHILQIENGLVKRFDIRGSQGQPIREEVKRPRCTPQ